MQVELHRKVFSDIAQIMDYYEGVAGEQLAQEFYGELRASFKKAADVPQAYEPDERGLRRVNLERFPYHFLFRIVREQVRVLIIRHHRRRPSLGIGRR